MLVHLLGGLDIHCFSVHSVYKDTEDNILGLQLELHGKKFGICAIYGPNNRRMDGSIKIVLDTCALIWWSLDPDKLSQKAKEACEQMEQQKNGLVPSTAIWEIAIKVNNRKLDLGVNIDDYIATLKKSDVVRIIPINEEIWLDSVRLKWEHRDPVDRVVVAITQRDKANVITADQKIASFYSSVIW